MTGLYKLDFDVLNDLIPIAEVAYEPLMICVKNALPVRNLQELIAWLKANPGKASVGIPGAVRPEISPASHFRT